jgi:hypothetical protein
MFLIKCQSRNMTVILLFGATEVTLYMYPYHLTCWVKARVVRSFKGVFSTYLYFISLVIIEMKVEKRSKVKMELNFRYELRRVICT